LKIVQWNADGLKTKIYELKDRLISKDIDICMIQESKLRIGDPTPRILGYAALRDDRKALNGGGLITYIKDSLIFERIGYYTRSATEVMSFRVKLARNQWLQLTNVGHDASKIATDIINVTNVTADASRPTRGRQTSSCSSTHLSANGSSTKRTATQTIILEGPGSHCIANTP
jgi:exonuclease III